MTWFVVAHQVLYLVDIPGGYNPNASGIPGAGTLMDITNWTAFLVLGLCVLGLVASIAGMVFGRAPGNAGVGIVSTLALPVVIVGVILTVNAYSLLNAFAHVSTDEQLGEGGRRLPTASPAGLGDSPLW